MEEPSATLTAWLSELAKRADENRVRLAGLTPGAQMAEIERLALFGEVVICVWPDAAKPQRIDLQIIRGLDLLHQATSGPPQDFITSVIPCVELSQAIALERHMRKKYRWKRQKTRLR